jgi:hypothetical protein
MFRSVDTVPWLRRLVAGRSPRSAGLHPGTVSVSICYSYRACSCNHIIIQHMQPVVHHLWHQLLHVSAPMCHKGCITECICWMLCWLYNGNGTGFSPSISVYLPPASYLFIHLPSTLHDPGNWQHRQITHLNNSVNKVTGWTIDVFIPDSGSVHKLHYFRVRVWQLLNLHHWYTR